MGKYTYQGENKLEKPSKKKLQQTEIKLKKFFMTMDLTPMRLDERIRKTIETCIYGWYRCPGDFDKRILLKMGPNSKKLKKRRDKKRYNKVRSAQKFVKSGFFNDIELSEDEAVFADGRYQSYTEDFEFNSSSDQMMLKQLIVDEILINRLEIERLMHVELDQNVEMLNEKIQDRYRKNLLNLGVSRQQRVEYDQNIEGNVGQLSMNVEGKLENIKEISDPKVKGKAIKEVLVDHVSVSKEELEELVAEIEFKRKHDLFPEKNYISEAELLGAAEV